MDKLLITVYTDKGRKQIEAECDRGLAIHPTVGFGDHWCVTHMASGLSVMQSTSLHNRNDALYAMGVMLSWGIDWSVDDVAGTRGLGGRVKKLAKEMARR